MNAMSLYLTAYLIVSGSAQGMTLQPDPRTNELTETERELNKAHDDLGAQVLRALGFSAGHLADGDTATRLSFWSQHELNAVYERVGGVVTSRTVHRTYDGETTVDTEITVTTALPGIGTVQLTADWYEPYGGHDLPLMRAITALAA
jgi:hypothetical protein